MAPCFIYRALQRVIVLSISLYYGLLVLLDILWRVIRHPSILRKAKHPMPKCLMNPDLGEHCFVRTKSGIRFHYMAKGDPTRPLMLLVHGYPEFWYSWRHQIKEFASRYRVVAIDMRGYGESDKPPGKDSYKLPVLVKDLKDIIDSLGYTSCMLVAHDWGGYLSWLFAHQYPEYVSKLIIINGPHPGPARKHLEKSKSVMKKTWYMYFFQLPYLPELFVSIDDFSWLVSLFTNMKQDSNSYVGNREEDIEAFKYSYSLPGAVSSPINYYRQMFNFVIPTEVYKRKIEAPTLVIWGTGDFAMEKEILHGLEKFVNDLEIRYVEGGSHFIQQDEPAIVNKLMDEFLIASRSETYETTI